MSRKVLVIDDDASIREVIRLTLEHVAGWQVEDAPDAAAGLAAAVARPPDAVLLDVMMPGTDGPATLRLLRADDRSAGLPVVFLTAKIMREERARLEAMGAAGVIAKPFDPMQLPSLISDALGWV